ncbi:hypothetical protein C8R42DRAFT_698557 [Lentinula raphanica]|nr:hypothetical protein C8R42DRAFT_698557 [Lentinula raphanica]
MCFPTYVLHALTLCLPTPLALLCNFSIESDCGLVKNVHVRVVALGQRVITVRLIPNSNIPQSLCNDDILIPRISFSHVLHSGHTLLRQQFPLAPAYATTFNSCQGLTLDVIGVDLSVNVFSHGQLYTALSRVCNCNALGVRLLGDSATTTNITYSEILLT